MKKLLLLAFVLLSISIQAQENTENGENASDTKIEEKEKMAPRDRFMFNFTFDNVFHKETNGFKTQWHSRGFGIFYMYDIPIKDSRFSIAPGLGFSHASYYHNSFMVEDSSGTSFNPIDDYGDNDLYKKHKLAVNYLDIPIELRFFSKPFKNEKMFKLALGIKASVRLNAVNAETNKINGYYKKIKTKGFQDVSTFRAGPTLRIGYGGFNIIAYYGVTQLFKKNSGPKMTPFSIGISIIGL